MGCGVKVGLRFWGGWNFGFVLLGDFGSWFVFCEVGLLWGWVCGLLLGLSEIVL